MGRTGVHSLPCELLSMIFEEFVRSFLPGWWEAPYPGVDYRWVALFEVCRTWRDTALATAALFKHLDFRRLKPEVVVFWIDHSGLTDLCVWLPLSSPAVGLALEKRPSFLHHIKRLHLEDNVAQQPWTQSTALIGVCDIFIRDPRSFGLALCPSIGMFTGLRRLIFEGWMTSQTWTSSIFPLTLEHLELWLEPVDFHAGEFGAEPFEQAIVSTGNLVAGLRNLSMLRFLLLSIDIVHDGGHSASVPLPKLRSLSLRLRDPAFPVVCRLFTLPQDTGLDITFRLYDPVRAVFSATKMVTQFVKFLNGQPERYRKVVFDMTLSQVVVTLYDSVGRTASIDLLCGYKPYLKSILGAIDAGAVLSVGLSECGEVPGLLLGNGRVHDAVLEGLTLLNNVGRLDVRGDIAFLVKALFTRLESGYSSPSEGKESALPILWPSLRSLRLFSMRRNQLIAVTGAAELSIESMLRARMRMGRNLEVVKVYGCDFKMEGVRDWATVASTVVICCEQSFPIDIS